MKWWFQFNKFPLELAQFPSKSTHEFRLRLRGEVRAAVGGAVQGGLLDAAAAERRDGRGQGLQLHVRDRDAVLYLVLLLKFNPD